ncbi:uncharacterized protein B0P05DRAFT_560755 [Gilbertella persicaria]|uniref:uncharacterized protein n=1 Tax=Gilbertella persicaria TaxID=101096 RepID=UPI00221E96DB|nr:uncharacterized protein B0P05DRAFT_566158 [Gilbertella persicaria]XP_051429463.1 uncharacterized protein B0P05DRAFT_564910 [Gilbertella persicaria]XP_051430347.1 uncharacterized protein B0P05DRAFT_560755 [Gilbertella persicaria]KAI8047407.1 hypothetical protein B0P05DRAFT_566158 [Gilbertella persicaria]KAI8048061.1 hypothetical protein B0P05DRAFT_564910 [Gilbertella persicaria]KAI8054925.1 hypothetical protein B0P05DRAFT_560755 [Gilbertella persicaria]
MSIEPEIPYTFNDDEASDNDDDWRDTTVRIPSQSQSRQQTPTIDMSLQHARADTPVSSGSVRSFTDTTVVPETVHRNADDYWVLPAHFNPMDILGGFNKARAKEIQRASNSYIEYNSDYNQIDIWGDEIAIKKTKEYLDTIAARANENDTRSLRKTKKWSKPERELTEREKRRAERKQAKMDEEKRYQGLPAVPQNFHAVFPLPDKRLPLVRFMGDRGEEYFNSIRAECKAFLWYEEVGNLIRINADTEESVREAGKRVRNWYLRCCRKPIGSTLRLLQQPSKQWLLRYRRLPSTFVTYTYADPEREKMMLEKHRLLETVAHGTPMSLISLSDERPQELSEQGRKLNARNETFIEQSLADGIESLRLNDWMVRMKIRYGSICLMNYPKKDDKYLSIEKVSDKIFRKPMFKSALAPCMSKTRDHLQHLFDYLSNGTDAVEYSENPRTSFVVHAKQYPAAAPPRVSGQREASRGDMWDTVMQVSFTETGSRLLWNTMTDCTDLVDINCTNIEGRYSWDLKLQHARQLPNNDFDTPHSKFWQALRISPDKRLIMATFSDYVPHLVTQKTKWLYNWKGYVVEVCKDEIWDMTHLTAFEPHRSLYKLGVDRFAENLTLKIGEAPSWTLRDFLGSEEENVRAIMKAAKEFGEILHDKVPLYWDSTSNSLV